LRRTGTILTKGLQLQFEGAAPPPLGTITTGKLTGTGSTFVKLTQSAIVPAKTRSLEVALFGDRNAGSYCDAYFDNVVVKLHTLS